MTASEQKLSRIDVIGAWAGAAILALTVWVFLLVPTPTPAMDRISPDRFYIQFDIRFNLLLAGSFLGIFCLAPALVSAVKFLQHNWRGTYTYGSLLGLCIVLWVFILHFGRWQYGAWDFNILIDTGWREVLGQRAFVDFVSPNPPGFDLGIKYAFELFGLNWDANLYFSAIFACLTFLWMYWLMVQLPMGRLASMATAFAVESAAMLTLCFWWYNNSVLILAAVFFLACLAYAKQPRSAFAQSSYLVSLALLSLMKPNIAGVMIVGGVVLLFLATDEKLRLVLLTLVAAAASIGLLFINHVSISAMMGSYLSAAKGRGSIAARFGYSQMTRFDRHTALLWIAALSIPLLGVVPRLGRQIAQRDWRSIPFCLFFPLSLLIAVYGLATNGEFRNAECTVLLVAGAVLSFGLRWNGPLLRRFYIAIVCASMVGDLYYGIERIRVCTIGPHMFFEWQDNHRLVDSGFFKNMRVSSTMVEVEREVGDAIRGNPGSTFLGPRLDFNYAVFGLTPPLHLPVYWQPGTSFAASDQGRLVRIWQAHEFQTLIFLKVDDPAHTFIADSSGYTFYSDEFLAAISGGYVADNRYSMITVYHRHGTGPTQP